MVRPGFLALPEVQAWLGGIEPAWTLLDAASIDRLLLAPDEGVAAIRIAERVPPADLAASAVATNALALLRKAETVRGFALTATGNLNRAAVAEMLEAVSFPDYNKAEALHYNRVINERDVLPLEFTRIISQSARLLRRLRGRLRITKVGRSILTSAGSETLQPALFLAAFWRTRLDYFDRIALDTWPQSDIAIVLWSLAVSATAWETAARLARLCYAPLVPAPEVGWDLPTVCFETRVLRPLTWFGLLEREPREFGDIRGRTRYRKTPAFDRLISFDVHLERPTTTRH